MDNLIVSFKYHVNSILERANNYASQMNAQYNSELVMDFPKLAKFLKWFPSKNLFKVFLMCYKNVFNKLFKKCLCITTQVILVELNLQ